MKRRRIIILILALILVGLAAFAVIAHFAIDRVLTTENLTTFAAEENVIVFLVDRFSDENYYEAMEACPEIFDDAEGFTFFSDYISRYPRTFPSIPYLMTGVENDFSMSRNDYFEYAYQNGYVLKSIKEAGFDINIYTDPYYGFDNASCMMPYVTNVSHKFGTVGRLLRYHFSSETKSVYDRVDGVEFTLRNQKKGYSFIHIAGCHMPNYYNADLSAPAGEDDRWDTAVAMKQTFLVINQYLRELKRLGLYENTTILIMGDHCYIGSDYEYPYYPHLTGLMVKPAGVSSGETVISDAPVQTEDVLATILRAAGASLPDPAWRTVFEIGEDEARTRTYFFHRISGEDVYDEGVYEITGSGKDFENWKLISTRPLDKSIYD